jgi:SAM-dependent methyltransferase
MRVGTVSQRACHMDRLEYQKLFQIEDRFWWYEALRRLTVRAIEQYHSEVHSILDAGCGTGGLLSGLEERFADARIVGFDLSSDAMEFSRRRGLNRLLRSSITDIGLRSESFDVVVCHDVLSQRVEPRRALDELTRVLRPGGLLILNTSALECLRTAHDRYISDGRRFTRGELVDLAAGGGLDVVRASYWNALLLPAIMAMRMARNFGNRRVQSALPAGVPYWNGLLRRVIWLETQWLSSHTLPIGMSVFCVARKH